MIHNPHLFNRCLYTCRRLWPCNSRSPHRIEIASKLEVEYIRGAEEISCISNPLFHTKEYYYDYYYATSKFKVSLEDLPSTRSSGSLRFFSVFVESTMDVPYIEKSFRFSPTTSTFLSLDFPQTTRYRPVMMMSPPSKLHNIYTF